MKKLSFYFLISCFLIPTLVVGAEEALPTGQYSNLWPWLAAICRQIESIFLILHSLLGSNWGIVIIVFAILLKILFLPLHVWVAKLQARVNQYKALLEPKLKDIKLKYDGEEAHNRMMAEYKALGITPFYTLKPMVGVLVQIPVLIAIFNVLGTMPELTNAPFLWIHSLSEPDSFATLPFTFPWFGNKLNLLPFLMTGVSVLSTLLFKTSKKYHLYLMAVAFFILFYPFPAGMVLFWTMMNLLQLIQQQIHNRIS